MTKIVQKELSYSVVGVAMEVHRKLGPGLNEFRYHQAMLEKFRACKIHGVSKPKGKLTHKGRFADGFEPDFLIDESLILELKHLETGFSPEHFAQLICYLKHWNCRLGMLLDFGKESLVCKRVVYDSAVVLFDSQELIRNAVDAESREMLAIIGSSIAQIVEGYGLGFRAKTYKALMLIELESSGLRVRSPVASIKIDQLFLGESELPCFVVNDCCVIRIVALQDDVRAADRATTQTYLKHLGLEWGLLLNFGKSEFQAKFITPHQAIRNSSRSP